MSAWPDLRLEAWQDTYATIHMWSQVVGKVRMAKTPPENHWWHVPLYLTSRGLTTSPIPDGPRTFQLDFDFLDHSLDLTTSDGDVRSIPLRPMTVADFHRDVLAGLRDLEIDVRIWPFPVEVPDPIPFEEDTVHGAYDAEWATRLWRALAQADRVTKAFRNDFLGKASPVHFFWGGFDLASTRFSGREAPPHPGVPGIADSITREGYSHECWSAGWWPGAGLGEPAFYAYAYPTPEGLRDRPVEPAEAGWNETLGEFVLPYEAVRSAADPDAHLLAFLRTTYAAAADAGGWDRDRLERPPEEAVR
ncbi:MAG TPA: DUF5996 family protein [Gemmatimonadota bacterium]|nr:DUF5996 family protein [Gemmatimonadota bacterium]